MQAPDETERLPAQGGLTSTTDALEFWDGVYAARPAAETPRPNVRLTGTVPGLAPAIRYPSPREVATGIDLDPRTWPVQRADAPSRITTGPDGRTAEVTDHVLLIRRTA
ncbi:hypothetical protein [Streptomyces paradoxus]|uniref:hypothetical protein n=1 Tax=Streptomyces paradoxus TaxID=66375 RepID=UPI0038003AB5